MKTIKDILKTDNIEQRRRIAKNLAISREDKNALITNESSGGGGDSNGITYYKVNLDNASDDNFSIGPAGYFINNANGNFKPLAIGVLSYIKIVTGMLDDNDNFTDEDIMCFEGTLKEVIDAMAKALGVPFNFFDYLEPITKEEFYNIKPE